MWRVDGEGFILFVPRGCCFETTNVGAMAKLSLSIASDDLVVVGLCKPLLLLLGSSLAFKRYLNNQHAIRVIN
jgi:hypothetical protein